MSRRDMHIPTPLRAADDSRSLEELVAMRHTRFHRGFPFPWYLSARNKAAIPGGGSASCSTSLRHTNSHSERGGPLWDCSVCRYLASP